MIIPKRTNLLYHNSYMRMPITHEQPLQHSTVHLQKDSLETTIKYQILTSLKEWRVEQLTIDNQNNQKWNVISEIKLSNLSILNLQRNNIESIENLHRMFCPELTSISLKYNHICDVKMIRKWEWAHLREIQIDQNCIRQLLQLSQITSQILKYIKIQLINPLVYLAKGRSKVKEIYWLRHVVPSSIEAKNSKIIERKWQLTNLHRYIIDAVD